MKVTRISRYVYVCKNLTAPANIHILFLRDFPLPVPAAQLCLYNERNEFVVREYNTCRSSAVNVYSTSEVQHQPKRLNTQSAGPLHLLTFCPIHIFLLTGRTPQYAAGEEQQGMNSARPTHWNIKSSPASQAEVVLGQLSRYLLQPLGHQQSLEDLAGTAITGLVTFRFYCDICLYTQPDGGFYLRETFTA